MLQRSETLPRTRLNTSKSEKNAIKETTRLGATSQTLGCRCLDDVKMSPPTNWVTIAVVNTTWAVAELKPEKLFHYCSSRVNNCDDHLRLHLLIRSSNTWFQVFTLIDNLRLSSLNAKPTSWNTSCHWLIRRSFQLHQKTKWKIFKTVHRFSVHQFFFFPQANCIHRKKIARLKNLSRTRFPHLHTQPGSFCEFRWPNVSNNTKFSVY